MKPSDGSTHFKLYSDVNITASTTERTLTSTYVAHKLQIWVKLSYPASFAGNLQFIGGVPVPLINELSYGENMQELKSFIGGGLFYNDGTNRAIYRNSYCIKSSGSFFNNPPTSDALYLKISRWIVWQAGSVVVPAKQYRFRAGLMVPDYNDIDVGGKGGGGEFPPKYYYYDDYIFDTDGTQLSYGSGFTSFIYTGDEARIGRDLSTADFYF